MKKLITVVAALTAFSVFSATQTSKEYVDAQDGELHDEITAHKENGSNPHGVTAAQVDAYSKDEADEKFVSEEADPTVPEWAKMPEPPRPDVSSVNLKTGDVTLYANDVGAYSKEETDAAIASATPVDYANVSNKAYSAVQEETDPNVPEWAKRNAKPTYSAVEVGAVADDFAYANVKNKALSAVQSESDPTIYPWAKSAVKPTYTPLEIGAVANDSVYAQVASKAVSALQWDDISPDDNRFSAAVLAVGLNIDTNSVAVLNEIAASFGGFPITGTATTIGGLLAALAAAVAWLRKRSVVTVELSDPNETMAQIKSRIDGLKNNHVLFDTSSINVENRMYLCGVNIDVENGGVRIQDTKTGRIYIGPYIGTETILQVLSKAVDEYVPITVTAIRKDGNAVTGKTVYLYEGNDDTGELIGSIVYNGEPVMFKVGGGFHYFVKIDSIDGLFMPTTASGIANVAENVTLVYGDADHILTYEDVKMALAALGTVEAAKEKLVYRVVIADTWTDLDSTGDGDNDTTKYPAHPLHDENGHPIWDDPMICTNVEMVEDADGNTHLGAIFMRLYATAKKIQFDAPNQEVATEETAQAGITYYGMTKGQTTPSTSNLTVLSLSEGDLIPYSSYEKVYKNAYNDSGKSILVNGHNRYETSAYRKYLCADKSVGAGQWWSQGHVGQVSPTDGDFASHPYQAGCSEALLAAIKPIKRVVASNTKCDGGQDYIICDPFWLPAVREMYGTTSTQEGSEQDEYWQSYIKDSSVVPNNNTSKVNAVRKQYQVTSKTGSAVSVRLRSAYVSYSYHAYTATTTGIVLNTNARTAYAGLPACAIY